MYGRWGAGIVPAIGWTLPVLMLATGLSTARGDELSDLRANQELLQRRIDQLAQVPPPPPAPPGGPGGPVLAGSFPLCDPPHRGVAAPPRGRGWARGLGGGRACPPPAPWPPPGPPPPP